MPLQNSYTESPQPQTPSHTHKHARTHTYTNTHKPTRIHTQSLKVMHRVTSVLVLNSFWLNGCRAKCCTTQPGKPDVKMNDGTMTYRTTPLYPPTSMLMPTTPGDPRWCNILLVGFCVIYHAPKPTLNQGGKRGIKISIIFNTLGRKVVQHFARQPY